MKRSPEPVPCRQRNTNCSALALALALVCWAVPPAAVRAQSSDCDCQPPEPGTAQSSANPNFAPPPLKPGDPIPPYLNPQLPVEKRIDDLLPRMTLEEKINQLIDSWGSQGIPRLRIPAMLKTEGLHSQSYSTGSTLFPMPIEMAGTFDPSLINHVGVATAVEAKAANLRVSWSPVLDVARDARWGRVEETYGEDPYLVSRMGVAWICGFQSQNMIASPKHFAGHGQPLGGRDSNDVGLSDRAMREIHLVPFRAAIEEAHAGGIMAAYSTWDGTPDNASTELLQNILRQEWGFNGFVVSDCGGPEQFLTKQSVVSNLEAACALAIRAGVDIECGSAYKKALAAAVRDGLLAEEELDANVRDVLRAKFKLGLFEQPGPQQMVWDKLPAYDTAEHRALARQVATEGIVLLKNEAHLLPLSKNLNTIAVIGPNADQAQAGDYSPKIATNQMVSVLQAVRDHVGAATKVLYAKGCATLSTNTAGFAEALDAARQADAVILVVGDHSYPDKQKGTTGENTDGATLEIPGVQRDLIRQIQATGKPVVLVLVNGKPFTLAWEDQNIPAILETWYPGEEGGNATADLIFGDQNPSGRLPITFPRSIGQLPLNYDYLPSGRNYSYYDMPFTPLYRFGHGLSYTTFRYANLTIVPQKNDPARVTVSVDITNTGDRDGDDVTQLYLTDTLTSVITPVIELKGVKRVALKKGETKTVTFELTPYQLSFLDAGMKRVIEPAKFRVHVGGECPEPPAGNAEHKFQIGFKNPADGVSGDFDLSASYQADFNASLAVPAHVQSGTPFLATVTVTNAGNLLDIATINLYGETLLGSHRFEIAPGATRQFAFNVQLYHGGTQTLAVIMGKKALTRTIDVAKSPANLALKNVRTSIGDDGVLHYQAEAANTGSETYRSPFNLTVDGKIAASQSLVLAPGARQRLDLSCDLPHSGAVRVKLGNGEEHPMDVPGGLGLALAEPLIYLNFDADTASGVKNQINGSLLPVQGQASHFVPGKAGLAFETGDKDTYVKAGNVDLYRKPFTLAAWVKISSLADGQAMFFGGQAPMGADVDTTGTGLAAGIMNGGTLLSFWNRDIRDSTLIPDATWAHVAFTYNPVLAQGAIYINGKLEKLAPQQPYAGPLEMIGGAVRFNHGKFALDDVLVARDCLGADAIAVLASQGVAALQSGQLVTGWRPLKAQLKQLSTWAEIPAGADVNVSLEIADRDQTVIDSKTIALKAGYQKVPLSGLKAGTSVRLKIQLAAAKWGNVPLLHTVLLQGDDDSIRWSSPQEWQNGKPSGGIVIEK